jgi:hypothetical protein
MTTRDRLMLVGIVALAVLLGAWFMTVAPERERAAKVSAEAEAARKQLTTAESQVDSAKSAQAQYSGAYTSLVSLGQAVPSSSETPALIYTLDKTTHSRDVQFSSIATGATGTAGGSSSASAASAAVAAASFSQEPFTFIFNGTFVDLYKLLDQLEGFTVQTSTGALHVNGRLLTIDSVSLAPGTEAQSVAAAGKTGGSTASTSKPKSSQLTGTITATAYVLPASASSLGGATAAGPAGASPAAASSSSSSSSSAATPAVIKASP